MKEYQFFGSHKYIVVPLCKMDEDEFIKEPTSSPRLKVIEFTDPKKYGKYIMADSIFEIVEKCDAEWLDDFESQILYPDKLPTAIEIVSKAIKLKKNASFVDYLEQTKEMMELALSLGTLIEFAF